LLLSGECSSLAPISSHLSSISPWKIILTATMKHYMLANSNPMPHIALTAATVIELCDKHSFSHVISYVK
jgi:hypothetical protein